MIMTTREEKLKKIHERFDMMTDEQLDQVAGGTVGEFADILEALAKQKVFKITNAASAHIPELNLKITDGITSMLREIGIEANIDLGYHGTGLGSKKNTYKSTVTEKNVSCRGFETHQNHG